MKMVSKISGLFAGALLLAAITTGCVVSAPYGGAYAGVYGEYPSTYYGSGAYYPVYPRYEYWHGHYYHHHDDWDHGHYYGGHAYGHGSGRVRGHGDGHEHH